MITTPVPDGRDRIEPTESGKGEQMISHSSIRTIALRWTSGLALATCAASVVQATGYFQAPWRSFETAETSAAAGNYLLEVASGDLNGDGRDDVVVGQAVVTGRLKVFLASGSDGVTTANFEAPVTYPLSHGAWGVCLADLDGDGDLDIAATDTDLNATVSQVAVLRNDGNGAFGAATYFPAGPNGPAGITSGDFDADGDLDLAVANWGLAGTGDDITILSNDGNAAFGSPLVYPVSDSPYRLESGDLDGDGNLDLAVAHDEGATVSVLLGAGDGSFGPPTDYSGIFGQVNVGLYAAVALIDADVDGDLDIAYTSSFAFNQSENDGRLALLRNDGFGAFQVDLYPYELPFENVVFDLAVADLNGDVYPDLVGAQYHEAGFLTFLGDGNGGFLGAEPYASADDVIAIATPDFDGDGDSDVATVNRLYPLLGAHENAGDGTFGRLPIFGDMFVHFVVDIGDVNGDGNLDAVSSHSGASHSTVNVFLGDGNGLMTQSYQTPEADYGFAKLRDLDGDGWLDLLFVSAPDRPPYDFFTAKGDGAGSFGPVVRWPLGTCGSAHPAAFDLDVDGDLDVINTEDRGCPGVPFSGERLFISMNNGDGTFQPAFTLRAGLFPRNVDAGDFDEDGHLDLATVGNGTDAILFGNGDGTFEPWVPANKNYVSDNILVRDWDEDGHLDIVALESVSNGVDALGFLWGDGAGGFTPGTEGRHPSLPSRLVLATGDIDNDGDDDVFLDGEQDVLAFINDGARQWVDGGRYGIGRDARAITFGDANNDGVGDIIGLASIEQPSGLYGGLTILPGVSLDPAGVEDGFDAVSPTAVEGRFSLRAVGPNPFTGGTAFRISVEDTQDVRVDLFDAEGRRIRELYFGSVERHSSREIQVDGTGLSSGIYWMVVQGETFEAARKALLVR